ncbi:MAG: peptidoglycan-binding protein [Deltaproteobacteria bacterium]|nr:peptidoglycan-binding protein [Deltaproteobacteria bacterium]
MRRKGILLVLLLVASFVVLPGQVTARELNATIQETQKRLANRGLNPGPIDGLWGGRTERALKRFQKDSGLPATGRLDRATRKKLGLKGSVIELLFYYSPDCTHGSWQSPTITAFQKKHPEVIVTWRKGKELKRDERRLIEGTEGNPVMAFHEGESIMSIVGTAMIEGLEAYLKEFQGGLKEARSTGSPLASIRGSGVACQ